MDIIHSLANDTTFLYAVILFIFSFAGLVILKYFRNKTGIPTGDIQAPLEAINEQAKADIVESVMKVYRNSKTGKFVSTKPKVLPANDDAPENKESTPQEEEEPKEEEEPAKEFNPNIGMYMLLFLFLIPFYSCSILDAGVKYAKDNIQITWKGDEASDNKPIDSIVVKFEPVYWKENSNSFLVDTLETETEFYKDGYRVWCLTTPTVKRYEVQRKDTVIYIYKK